MFVYMDMEFIGLILLIHQKYVGIKRMGVRVLHLFTFAQFHRYIFIYKLKESIVFQYGI